MELFKSFDNLCKAQCIDEDVKDTILALDLIGNAGDYTYIISDLEDMDCATLKASLL